MSYVGLVFCGGFLRICSILRGNGFASQFCCVLCCSKFDSHRHLTCQPFPLVFPSVVVPENVCEYDCIASRLSGGSGTVSHPNNFF